MLHDRFLLEDIGWIYAQAHLSEDGQRCMVSASPELRARIQRQMEAMRAMADGVPAVLFRFTEQRRLGFNDGVIIPPSFLPPGVVPSLIRSAAALRAPLRGVLRVIVVLADFEDRPMTQSADHFRQLFFASGGPTKSVRDYYAEVTHGLIDIQGEVAGPFRLPHKLSEYAHGHSGIGNLAPNAQTMARDALIAADPSVDFTPYDNDGDGFVDAYIVVHSGPAAEVTGSPNDIWSHKWVLEGDAQAVDRTHVYGYLTVPEDAKIGVCCHELGHLLFGFPDLYDTDYSSEGIGDWCLMAGGSWGGGGSCPVHPSAWCKANQGWVSVDNIRRSGDLRIPDVKTTRIVYRLWTNGAMGNEYFLLENRQQQGFDAALPAPGLLIWHIDDSISDNTNEAHYKVALMQADGQRDLEQARNRGDKGDPYPGSTGNRLFTFSSNPSSKSYAGTDTHVSITQISPSQPIMTAHVRVTPAIRPLPAPLSEVLTRLQSRLTSLEAGAARQELLPQNIYFDGGAEVPVGTA